MAMLMLYLVYLINFDLLFVWYYTVYSNIKFDVIFCFFVLYILDVLN